MLCCFEIGFNRWTLFLGDGHLVGRVCAASCSPRCMNVRIPFLHHLHLFPTRHGSLGFCAGAPSFLGLASSITPSCFMHRSHPTVSKVCHFLFFPGQGSLSVGMKKGTFIPLEVGGVDGHSPFLVGIRIWGHVASPDFSEGSGWGRILPRKDRRGPPHGSGGGVDPRSHRSVSGSFPFGRPIPPERFPFCAPVERGEALGFFSFGIQAQDQNPAVRQAHLRARARHGDERCASRVPRVEEGKETNRKSTFGRGDGANGRGGRRRVGSAEGDGTRSDP